MEDKCIFSQLKTVIHLFCSERVKSDCNLQYLFSPMWSDVRVCKDKTRGGGGGGWGGFVCVCVCVCVCVRERERERERERKTPSSSPPYTFIFKIVLLTLTLDPWLSSGVYCRKEPSVHAK